ncbi:MAG TPA: hypothetical protein ENH82_04445 [bacterium]|nr:hypothetical protein [bacterium]
MNINKARVNFKHYGNLPDPSEGIKFQVYTEDFLKETMQLFFNIDFDDISFIDLILNDQIKEIIKKAEQNLKENKIEECIINCAKAEIIITEVFTEILPLFNVSTYNLLSNINFKRGRGAILDREFRYIGTYMNYLRTFTLISIININISKHIKFRNIITFVSRAEGGEFIVKNKRKYSSEEADYCLKYIIDLAIAVQDHLPNR